MQAAGKMVIKGNGNTIIFQLGNKGTSRGSAPSYTTNFEIKGNDNAIAVSGSAVQVSSVGLGADGFGGPGRGGGGWGRGGPGGPDAGGGGSPDGPGDRGGCGGPGGPGGSDNLPCAASPSDGPEALVAPVSYPMPIECGTDASGAWTLLQSSLPAPSSRNRSRSR